ncbi:hypothetical protein QQX98_000897 [Neonectria punicea]|uniref:Zn(2)-C6 fungal-type domain-containing protein n=1 Tax=Neonectria punicea TaxID=979145 RepID=A0ABR1HSA7_9HYPO
MNAGNSDAKRRKIRKGTRSCWECKRRKIRCSFSAPSDPVYIGCRRRGVGCVGQEHPEESPAAASSTGSRGPYIGDRIVRVEALLDRLVKQAGNESNGSAPSEDGAPGPATSVSATDNGAELTIGPGPRLERITITPSRNTRYEDISAALHAALPPREDILLMAKAGLNVSFHKLMTHPHDVLAQSPGGGRADLDEIPDAKTHPTLLAKYLLILATCLQYANPDLHANEIRALSQPPRELMRRLADTAINLVISNDEFLGSFEGLECVMLETVYQANSGNLRRAWFACRRGLVVAQMMGLHRSGNRLPLKCIGPREPIYPNYMWFRIVWSDRQLCLLLGLPQGSLDASMASEAALARCTPSDRFERKQSVIASRIIERNDSSDPAIMDDFVALQELDAELQRAADEMPRAWWLTPSLANIVQDPEEAFWETLRLMEQMLYFNLLSLLHLPYMLRSRTFDTEPSSDSTIDLKHEYSKLTCVNASRELLSRFVTFRSFNRVAFACRSADFFALIGALTLVIAHLDGHRKQRLRQHGAGISGINVLAPQRNADRAMMDQVLENMEGVAQLSTDVLSERSSSLLRSLLALEADAAEGKHDNVDRDYFPVEVVTSTHPESAEEDGQSVRLGIPYIGTIRISREEVVSMESPRRDVTPSPIESRFVPTDIVPPSASHAPKDTPTVTSMSSSLSTKTLSSAYPQLNDTASTRPPMIQASSTTTQPPGIQSHRVDRPSTDENNSLAEYQEFAAPLWEQFLIVTKRVFPQYWRTPSYIYPKIILCISVSLFIGLVFLDAPLTIQGLQNQMFAIFEFCTILGQLVQQQMPHFVTQRSLYEARERPSKVYSWKVFMLSQIIVELPWNTLVSIFIWAFIYYPAGFYKNAGSAGEGTERGILMWLLFWQFLLFTCTFAHMCIFFSGTAKAGSNVANLLFMLAFFFCGVLASADSMPGFWIFLYRVSPLSYWVSAVLSTGLANIEVTCASNEWTTISPPDGLTCNAYMADYISRAGGYLLDPEATSDCMYCRLKDSNGFLSAISSEYSTRWRNFGIMWVYIAFNVVAALGLYYLVGMPKGKKRL